ncbi:MAG: hypothetical protein ABSG42_03685 [Nitrospirota bacterium]
MDKDTCGYRNRLVLYHYGELERDEAATVAAHVLACQECRLELQAIAALRMVTPQAPDQGQVRRAVDAVLSKIAPRKRSFPGRLIPAYIAAGAAAATLVLTLVIPHFSGHRQTLDNQVVLAQADWEVLDNMDVIQDLDVIEEMENSGLDQLGPISQSGPTNQTGTVND